MARRHADSDVVVAAILVLPPYSAVGSVSSHYCIWLLGIFLSLRPSGLGDFPSRSPFGWDIYFASGREVA